MTDLLAALAAAVERAREDYQARTCPNCGDDLDPADCPDRHTFEDHCLPCMGSCLACQHRLDDIA